MLIISFEILNKYDDSKYLLLSKKLTETSRLVCEGQQNDIDFSFVKHVSEEDYFDMIENNRKKIENSTGFNCYMDTIIRASTYKENIKKILIPFNTKKLVRNKIIKKGFIIETFFDKKINIKKLAKIRNCHSYLLKNKIIKLESV